MKVLLINSPAKNQPVVRDMAGGLGFDGGNAVVLPPLELAYMATTLVAAGDEVKMIDADVEGYTNDTIYQTIKYEKPDFIIATVSLPSIYNDCSFLKGIKQHASVLVVAKTSIVYPAILKEILEKSSADLCIYGECDLTIDNILSGKDRKGTASLINGELKIEENVTVTNLDELPLPARNLLPNDKYRYCLLGDKVTTMQTSRGCPFPCAFYCPYPLVQGNKWRSRSPEHVIKEIEDIVNNHGIKRILFRDGTFTLNKARAEKICGLIIQRKLNIEWWCETRVDCLDENLMKKMKQAGCQGMNIGVETGDTAVMETQAKIGLTLDKLNNFRDTAKRLGLRIHFLLMIGLPGEIRKSLYETYKLVSNLNPESMGACLITPYPGTPLYMQAKEKGWIETEDWTKFGGHSPVMHTDNLSSKDILNGYKMLSLGFYLSHKGPIGWLRKKILNHKFKKWASK